MDDWTNPCQSCRGTGGFSPKTSYDFSVDHVWYSDEVVSYLRRSKYDIVELMRGLCRITKVQIRLQGHVHHQGSETWHDRMLLSR